MKAETKKKMAENRAILDLNWWCNTHQRRPTGLMKGKPFCPGGGIAAPCRCVDLTGIAEIVEEP